MKHADLPSFKRAMPPLQAQPGNLFVRMCIARAVAELGQCSASDVARERWPDDHAVPLMVERAASTPATTTAPGWAAELARQMVAETLDNLDDASAGAALLKQCLTVTFDRAGAIAVPAFVSDPSKAAFVAEGQPIPVNQFALEVPALLQPHKVATIAVLTREMIEGSNAEALVADVLKRSIGGALDAALFDTLAASAARPAGLRYNIAGLAAASAGSIDAQDAFLTDIGALVDSVEPVADNGPLIFIGKPSRAMKMVIRFIRETPRAVVLSSSGVTTADVLICVVPKALAAAIGDDPVVETSIASALHMDSAPGPIDGHGPVRSLWQTDAVALKIRLPVTWQLRDPRGVAWVAARAW